VTTPDGLPARTTKACGRALKRADTAMAKARPEADPRWRAFNLDEPRLVGFKGFCDSRLGRARPAQGALEQTLVSTSLSPKRRSAYLAEFAGTQIQLRNFDVAGSALGQSLALAVETRAPQLVSRLGKVRASLAPSDVTPAIRQFDRQLGAAKRTLALPPPER